MRSADMDLVVKQEILETVAVALERSNLPHITHIMTRRAVATEFVDEVVYLEWNGVPVYLKIA